MYADPLQRFQHERYAHTFHHGADARSGCSNAASGAKVVADELHGPCPLIADLAGCGNEALYLNDPEGFDKQPHMAFVEVVHQGWPYLFIVAIRNINLSRTLAPGNNSVNMVDWKYSGFLSLDWITWLTSRRPSKLVVLLQVSLWLSS